MITVVYRNAIDKEMVCMSADDAREIIVPRNGEYVTFGEQAYTVTSVAYKLSPLHKTVQEITVWVAPR